MFETRWLTPPEAAARHTNGATNLVDHRGEWYSFGPRYPNERVDVTALHITMAAPALLGHLDAFGAGSDGLEFALEIADRFGKVRDVASTTLMTLEETADWRDGTHEGTAVILDEAADGTRRAALTGAPAIAGPPPPASVQWTSGTLPLRYGTMLSSVAWEIEDLQDGAGQPLKAYALRARVGRSAAGGTLHWDPWIDLTAMPQAYERREVQFQGPFPEGEFLQWIVELRSAPPPAGDGTGRKPIVFLLGTRILLPSSRWSFPSLAALLRRAAPESRLLTGGWQGNADVALLRIPLDLTLLGRRREMIRARLLAGGTSLQAVEVSAVGELGFDDGP